MPVNIPIRWADNTPELTAHLKEGLNQIEATKAGAERLAASLSGDKLIAAAHKYAAAVSEIGGVTKLTSAEADRINGVLEKAIAKYEALGQKAPDAMRELARATKEAGTQTSFLESAFGRIFAGFTAANLLDRGVTALFDFGKQAFATADALVNLSNKTGLSTETIQRMQFAAKQSGTDMQTFADAAFKLGVNISEGTTKARKAAEDLGLEWKTLRASSPDEQFNAIVGALEAMENPQKRNADAVALFGKTAREILPTIVDGYHEAAKAADVASDATVRATDRMGDALDRLGQRITTAFVRSVGGTALYAESLAKLSTQEQQFIIDTEGAIGTLAEFNAVIRAGAAKDIQLPAPKPPPAPEDYSQTLKEAEAAYRALTAAQRDNVAAAIRLGKTDDDIINGLDITAETLAVTKKHFEENKKSASDAAEAFERFYKAVEETIDAIAKFERETTKAASEEFAKFIKGQVAMATAIDKRLADTFAAEKTYGDKLAQLHRVGLDAELADIEGQRRQALALLGQAPEGMDEAWRRATNNINAYFAELADNARYAAKSIEQEFIEASVAADRAPEVIAHTSDEVDHLAEAFGRLGQIVGGTFGQILAGASQLATQIGKYQKALEQFGAGDYRTQMARTSAIYSGIGVGASLAASAIPTGGNASKGQIIAQGALVGAASGAAFGAALGAKSFNPWLIAGGAAAGAIVGWIRAGQEWRQVVQDISRDFEGIRVSDDFAKMIADLEDQAGIGSAQALTLALDQLVDAAGGLRSDNLDMFTAKLHDAFSMLERHELSLSQATSVLDKNFASFAAAATDSMGRLSDRMKEIIGLDEQFGTHSQAIADYVKSQGGSLLGDTAMILSAHQPMHDALEQAKKDVENAQKAVDDLASASDRGSKSWQEKWDAANKTLQTALDTQADLHVHSAETADDMERLGEIALQAFATAVASGTSMNDAFQALHPGLDQLRQDFETLGIPIEDAGLKALLLEDTIVSGNPKMISAIDGLTNSMIAQDNIRSLTPDQFSKMQSVAVGVYQNLYNASVAAGGGAREALVPMQSYLHEAQIEAAKLGVALDSGTQDLIDQSKAVGVWDDQWTAAKDPVSKLIDKIQELIDTLLGVPKKVTTDIEVNTPTPPAGPGHGNEPPHVPGEVPSYAEGSDGLRDFGPGRLVQLHGREAVLTEAQLGKLPVRVGGPIAGETMMSAAGGQPVEVHVHVRLSDKLTEEFIERVVIPTANQSWVRGNGRADTRNALGLA